MDSLCCCERRQEWIPKRLRICPRAQASKGWKAGLGGPAFLFCEWRRGICPWNIRTMRISGLRNHSLMVVTSPKIRDQHKVGFRKFTLNIDNGLAVG